MKGSQIEQKGFNLRTFRDYFRETSQFYALAEANQPMRYGSEHPYCRAYNQILHSEILDKISQVYARRILTEEAYRLFLEHMEGTQRFGLTERDWDERKSPQWKRWSNSCNIYNSVGDFVRAMIMQGNLKEENDLDIPEHLKDELTENLQEISGHVSELVLSPSFESAGQSY